MSLYCMQYFYYVYLCMRNAQNVFRNFWSSLRFCIIFCEIAVSTQIRENQIKRKKPNLGSVIGFGPVREMDRSEETLCILVLSFLLFTCLTVTAFRNL